jgi:hypothetical protein
MIKDMNLKLAEIGKIKIGKKGEKQKSKNGKEFRLPQKNAYFTITTLERDKNGDFVKDEAVHKIIGDKPKELDITFVYDDIDLNFNTAYQYYTGKTLQCMGDGEFGEWKNKDGSSITMKDCGKNCKYFKNNQCKVSGILNCMLLNKNMLGGVHKFRTHGFNSVSNILSSLSLIKTMTGGILQGLKFKLTLSPKYCEVEGVGQTTIYMANVVYESDAINLIQNALEMQEKRLKYSIDIKKLELEAKQLGNALTYDDPADVEEEFYNNNNDTDIETLEKELEEKANSKEIAIEVEEPPVKVIEEVIEKPAHKPQVKEEIKPTKPEPVKEQTPESKQVLELRKLENEFKRVNKSSIFKTICKDYLNALGAKKLSDLDNMTLNDIIKTLNSEFSVDKETDDNMI